MTAEACIAEIRAAAAGRLNDDEIADLVDEVQRRADARRRVRGGPPEPADDLLHAAREIASEMKAAAAIERRNATINAIRRAERENFYRLLPDEPARAIEALNVGVTRRLPGAGGKRSVDARQKAEEASLLAGLVKDLRSGGLLEYVTRAEGGPAARLLGLGPGPLDREIAAELWEMGREGGRPGVSGSDEARRIAEILHRWQETARQRQNRAGAWIGRQDGYIVAQSHDMHRIRRAGFDAWKAEILPRLDAERTFGTADPDAMLRGVFDGLVSGEHHRPPVEGNRLMALKGPANLARKVSQERVLHFRTAQDWYAYNERFGAGSLFEAAAGGLRRAADTIGLMQVWGTNPKAAFEADLAMLRQRHRGDPDAVKALNAGILRYQFAEVSGETRIPGNATVARWSAGLRAVQNMAKLGGATLSSITDVATYTSEVSFQGRGVLSGYAEALSNLAPGDGLRREIADRIGVGLEGQIGDVAARFGAADDLPGGMSKLQRAFFKLNLLSWWTDAHKTGAGFAMARELGAQTARDFADIPPALRDLMAEYGIDDASWAVMRRAVWTDPQGRAFLTPDRIQELADEDLAPLARDQLDGVRRAWGGRVEQLTRRYVAALDRMEAVAGLIDKAERTEVAGVVAAWRRKLDGVERLNAALDEARATAGDRTEAGQPTRDRWNRVRSRAVREANAMADAAAAIRADAAVRIDRLRERAARLAKADAAGALDAVRRDLDGLVDDLARMPDQLDASIANATVRLRDDLEQRLRAFIVDRVDTAVLTPGARERAALNRGTLPGTAVGEAMRFAMQFKSFSVAFTTRVLGREVYGRGARTLAESFQSGKGDWVGTAQLILSLTALGYVVYSSKEILKGREPRDPLDPKTWVAAFLQGGGAGIFGDFVFGEANRFSGGLVATAAGPTAGSAEALAEIMWRMRDGDDAAAQSFRFAINHTPGLNLFYVRPLLDFLILHDAAEALNPGALRRMERRIERENRQSFWLRPSQDRLRPITGG